MFSLSTTRRHMGEYRCRSTHT